MKFTAEVETESHKAAAHSNTAAPGGGMERFPGSRAASAGQKLNWNIEVEVKKQLSSIPEAASNNNSSLAQVRPEPQQTAKFQAVPAPAPALARPAAAKKMSSTSALLDRIGRNRKVSRQGEWLVITERHGLLTTQNGAQQVVERRVKLDYGDLEKLVELGF